MPTCQSCRKQYPDAAKHCPHCGIAQGQVPPAESKRTVFGYAANPADLQRRVADSAEQAGASDSPPSEQLDVMAKTMLASEVAGAEAEALPAAEAPVSSQSPGMGMGGVEVGLSDAARLDAQDIKWGGAYQIRDKVSNAIVSGRSFGRFLGNVPPAEQESLKALILDTVNATLSDADAPFNEIIANTDALVAQVNSQLVVRIQAMGITGKVAGIMVVPDKAPAQAGPAVAVASPDPETTGAGFPMKKVFGIVAAAIVAAIAAGAFYYLKGKFFGKGKGTAGYAQFGIDAKKAEADSITEAAEKVARRWTKLAVWWAVDVHGVGEGGVLDFTNGSTAKYTFIVPSRVMSRSKTKRKDSIKKIRFGPNHIDYKTRVNAKKRWKNIKPLPSPTCTISKLAKELQQRGLKGAKKVRISFDPTFAFGPGAPKELSWRVRGRDPKIDAWFSLTTCKLTRDRR